MFDGTWLYDIYVINSDGSGEIALTDAPQAQDAPAWSPDGHKIAFHRGKHIWVMNADGSGQTDLGVCGFNPAWSPTGDRIAYWWPMAYCPEGSTPHGLILMNTDGSDVTSLGSNEFDQDPTWSPDGTKIAVKYVPSSYIGEILVYDLIGARPGNEWPNWWNITDTPEIDERAPAWSPDGSEIAFHVKEGDSYQVWVMNADGTGRTQLATDAAHPAWSPDGSKIAFSKLTNADTYTWNICIINADGSGESKVTDNVWFNTTPTWGPN